MAAPKLEQIIRLMESGEPFSLTDSQYKRKTGLPIPKNLWYLLNRSAIAQKANEYGYKIGVRERELTFERVDGKDE